MKTIVIDNTRNAGNFFDNINNYEYLAQEYLIDKNGEVLNFPKHIGEKYDYINIKTINQLRDRITEFFWDKYAYKLFKLDSLQLQQISNFEKKHSSCVRKENGMNKFGTIGGGFELVYKINYNQEELMLPRCNFEYVQCLDCEEKDECINSSVEMTNKKFHYPKFDKIEFYRFMEIYNEYKQPLTIKITGTGLGWIFDIYVEDFIYNITNVDSW